MTRWKKGETEFRVGVNYVDKRGYSSSIPKPIMEVLGEPQSIKFVVRGKKVEVMAAEMLTDSS
jgi:hypothetical protein